ncbi:MAG: helix-turn-helix transcriptional regulator [Eubacteriales bacterium]|jgi:DNA-binding XRE family transcriptional regulator
MKLSKTKGGDCKNKINGHIYQEFIRKGHMRFRNTAGEEVFEMVYDLGKYRSTRKVVDSIIYGEWVSIARKDQGMTQEELGDRIGYSQSIVSRMESGKLDICPGDSANIAVALNNVGLLRRYCQQCAVCKAMRDMEQLKPRPAA